MDPKFVVEETSVREAGESPVCVLDKCPGAGLTVTLGITHALERESLDVEILTSEDGASWADSPRLHFPHKSYCGTYTMTLPPGAARFVKAVWRVDRWGVSGGRKPLFRFYVEAREAPMRALAGAA